MRGDDGRISAFVRSITEPGALADTTGYAPDVSFAQKVELLETLDVRERLELALAVQRERLAELQVRRRIRDDVESGAQKQQREYILRRQMESIRKELGEDDGSVVDEYRTKIAEAGMPEAVLEQAERELGRLERIGEQSAESSMIRAVPRLADRRAVVEALRRAARPRLRARSPRRGPLRPRGREGPDRRVPRRAQAPAGARDHRGQALRRDPDPDRPPGTGKTSIGESIARALGREFVRMSLGGVRDEAEIRGHRRTYIGALPGRLVRALRDAGTMNPVIMLDEVDKVGADWRGDPSAALLEVLDPAQNHSFRDHYLDVELDLSEVVFIATGNIPDTIPGPLLDRMEIIRFDGYTVDEKVAIARGYLWPRQRERNGLLEAKSTIEDEVAPDGRHRVHARGRCPPARAGARQDPAQDGDPDRFEAGRGAGRGRPRRRPRRARAPEVLPGGGRAHGRPGCRDRPGGDRHRRRRPVRRGHRDEGGRRARPHRPARRRHEGVGADRALLRASARGGARHRRVGLRRARHSTSTFRPARSRRTGRAPASRWRPRSHRCSRSDRSSTPSG